MRAVSCDARYLMLYLLTSPHRNILGLYFLPAPYACFDLGWDEQRFNKGLGELLSKGCIQYDKDNHVVLIINFLKHNPLENPNQVKSATDKLDELPKTPLMKDLYESIKEEKPHYKPLVEELGKRLNEPLNNPCETVDETLSKQEEVKEEVKETEEVKEYNVATGVANPDIIPAEKPSGSKKTVEDGGAQSKTGKDDYTKEFEEFWRHYPRRVEKKRAFRAWKTRLKEGIPPEDMLQACINYSQYCKQQRTEQKFIKHASTFLGPDKPYEEFIKGPPEVSSETSGPQSWDPLV